jgi:hypothetical protein
MQHMVDALRSGLANGLSRKEAMDTTGAKRMCCQMHVYGALVVIPEPTAPKNVTGHIEFFVRKKETE